MSNRRRGKKGSVPVTEAECEFDYLIDSLALLNKDIIAARERLGIPIVESTCYAARMLMARRASAEHRPVVMED